MSLPTLVLMGVSGSGKSTIGAMLAGQLRRDFVDADDLHPDANRERMAQGIALDDADRWPWLRLVARQIRQWDGAGESGVMACSALKRSYRDYLRKEAQAPIVFVHLDFDEDELAARLARRAGHFMPATLLASQLQALERPASDEPALTLHGNFDPAQCCKLILEKVTALAAELPNKNTSEA